MKKKSTKGFIFMLLSAFCSCFGQIFWKYSTNHNFLYLILGFIFYGIGAFMMIISYKFGEVSILQPIQSVNYVISTILGLLIFNEKISILKFLGILIICLGVVLLTKGVEND